MGELLQTQIVYEGSIIARLQVSFRRFHVCPYVWQISGRVASAGVINVSARQNGSMDGYGWTGSNASC